jgi:molybdate transport system ATP-binding protein
VWTDTETRTFVPAYRRAVGLVFQEYALFPHFTAVGNVMTALGHRRAAERRDKAEALLNLVHLGAHVSKRPHELSGGERQRVALARALARDPAVLLLDEPFAAVDRSVRRRLQNEIDSLRRTLDMPLILVTHDFEDVVRLATHVLMLERGAAVASGPIATLMSRPDLSWLREAVGLGSVLDATVTEIHAERGLVELRFDGGALLAPARHVEVNAAVRVRVPAREVVLATSVPAGLSLHNVLTGTVTGVHVDAAFDAVVVQLAIGRAVLLAEVTRDAVGRLEIEVGRRLHALIKSVSIDLLASESNSAEGDR